MQARSLKEGYFTMENTNAALCCDEDSDISIATNGFMGADAE